MGKLEQINDNIQKIDTNSVKITETKTEETTYDLAELQEELEEIVRHKKNIELLVEDCRKELTADIEKRESDINDKIKQVKKWLL
jgi:hypothetical protein